MPSSRYTSEPAPGPAINPLGPAEQLGHWLLTTTTHVALGLVIGFVLARQMRAMHLRWTWATVALAVVMITRPLLDRYALTCASAALCAAVRSRRWHREDIQAGADLAEIAGQRHGPLDALRSLVRTIERRPDSLSAATRLAILEWLRNFRGPDRGRLRLRDRPATGDTPGVDRLGDRGARRGTRAYPWSPDRRPRGGRPRGLDPLRRQPRWPAHARRGRDRLGQDGHRDLDRDAGSAGRHERDRGRPEGRSAHARRAR